MTLGLAVETTTVRYGVAVFAGREILAHRTIRRDTPDFGGIGDLAASVLAETGRPFGDLALLAVDVGPGNLTSVRAGISYVNGLGFSVGCPIVPVDSLSLLAREAVGRVEEPVLCLRNAGSGNVYAGLFVPGAAAVLRRGPLNSLVPELADGATALTVVGVFRDEVRALLPGCLVKDTGIDTAGVRTLHGLVTDPAGTAPAPVAVATPLTDSSVVFHG